MRIIKRIGVEEDFNSAKIISALNRANAEVEGDDRLFDYDVEGIAKSIEQEAKTYDRPLNVEEIQDMVEESIMSLGKYALARKYIKYRQVHSMSRDKYDDLMKAVADKLLGRKIDNQNANLDEHSFGGRMGEANDVVCRQFALDFLVSKKAKKNHIDNRVYIHDLNSYAVGNHNCLSVPFDDLLSKGFVVKQTDVRPAGSLNTAFQLVAVIFQLQSLQQFGGASATHLDWTMVPYVRKSFYKHFMKGVKYIENFRGKGLDIYNKQMAIDDKQYRHFPKAYEYAMDMTKEECHQAVEGMYHNLNTLQSRSGNQLPFTSINYGTCTLPEGRMVTKAVLDMSIEGLGKLNRTSIFPCGIFQCMKDVNRHPGDPNYDLFRLALKSTALRLYPNYCNVDWSGNAGYDVNDPRTYFSTMGALGGDEHLYVKIKDGDPIDIRISDLYDLAKSNSTISGRPCQIVFSSRPLNLPGSTKHVQDHSFKNCKPLPGVYKITYLPQDVSYIGSSRNMRQRWNEHKVEIRTKVGPDCGMKFSDPDISNYLFEVLEYTEDYKEAEKKYIMTVPNINVRGTAKRYYKIKSRKYPRIYEKPVFRFDLSVDQSIIDLKDFDIKVLDRGNKWVKVNHIFKNDKLNTPQMMHIIYDQFGKLFDLSVTEDHPLWDGSRFRRADTFIPGDRLYRADGLELSVVDVCWHWEAVDSYDIGTETGSFIGSDIIMHNCRTANGYDINGLGQLKDGRGNICPTTIILPTLAMEAKKRIQNLAYLSNSLESEYDLKSEFLSLLDEAISDARDALIERYNWICSQSPDSAKFMYENNLMAGYVPEEGIESALKHGTLAIGQIGLAETLQILLGCDHTSREGMDFAKEIEYLFNKRCKEFKEEYHLNFGVYYTPAENLCYTAMKKFKEKYGAIKDVSDKEFFTNSIHVPVWKHIDPFEKIDIESQLTGYSNAGCITYVELGSSCKHNLDALETLVNYAMDKDIPYFAINVPNDQCMECGYCDEMNDTCPKCGSKDIKRLRRVTGYLTNDYKTSFNKGKQQEVEMRVKHDSF